MKEENTIKVMAYLISSVAVFGTVLLIYLTVEWFFDRFIIPWLIN
jgi:hypothetical protein